jgi:hypothetical protein
MPGSWWALRLMRWRESPRCSLWSSILPDSSRSGVRIRMAFRSKAVSRALHGESYQIRCTIRRLFIREWAGNVAVASTSVGNRFRSDSITTNRVVTAGPKRYRDSGGVARFRPIARSVAPVNCFDQEHLFLVCGAFCRFPLWLCTPICLALLDAFHD